MALIPTAEQQTILDLFQEDGTLVIQAGAGTGKSSSLRMLAEANPDVRFQYLCFNRALADDAAASFPRNVDCQPDGTLVRVPSLSGGLGNGYSNMDGYREVPIEQLRDGDKVVSWNQTHGPILRKRGKPIRVTRRWYDGRLIAATVDGHTSRYTPEHPCIVTLDDAFTNKHVVYMMQRGEHFKIGLCSWRLSVPVRPGGRPRNGLWTRLRQEGADAVWLLGAFDDRDEAIEVEALTQYEWNIPGWTFAEDPRARMERKRSGSGRPLRKRFGMYQLWAKIPPNRERAAACLQSFGRSVERPFWSAGESMLFEKSIRITAACNLLPGMKVLVADNSITKGEFTKGSSPKRVWSPITLHEEWYSGQVTSLEVADDHTYIADGILTHNCRTAHSLAFRAVGKRFSRRLNSARMRSDQIARRLNIGGIDVTVEGQRLPLAAGFLGSLTMRALERFCQSADPEPAAHHFPYLDGIDMPDAVGGRTYGNNDAVRAYLLPALHRAWADWSDPDGDLVYKHSAYLKTFERSQPRVGADVVLVDEAQDVAPVLLSILLQQTNSKLVLVGDAQQELYAWAGATDAMAKIPADRTAWLTQSFRFGAAIAEQANEVLAMIPGAEMRLRGTPSVNSIVAAAERPDAVLCRTNATAVRRVLAAIVEGLRPHLVGGGQDVISFARAADDLMNGRRTSHPELACFADWSSVREYCTSDPQGDELRLMVRLCEEFGAKTIEDALARQPREEHADLIVSTGHRSKGREWAKVQLADDFREPKDGGGPDPAELRLLYVGVTRAKQVLDITQVSLLAGDAKDAAAVEIAADALVDGTVQPEPRTPPTACPECGRRDVVRSSGIVGAHFCSAVVGRR